MSASVIESSEVSPASPPVAAPPAAPSTDCPKCGGKLIDPGSLGWCPKCRYCRSLEEEGAKAALPQQPTAAKPSPFGIVEFSEMVSRLPRWLWVLLGGMAIVAGISTAAHFLLAVDAMPRALWSTIELVIGLLLILAAQAWSLILLAPHDDSMGPKDLILSVRLWSQTFRRLPEMRRQLWLGGWGATAAACALGIVGGFSYWYQYYKPKRIAEKGLLEAAAAMGEKDGKEKSLEDSVKDFADKQDLTKKKEDAKGKDDNKPDTRPTVQCVVIGYLQGDEGALTGLVLATLKDKRLSYAGTVERGFSVQATQELLRVLPRLRVPEPLIRGLRNPAIWVKPEVFCEVHHSGFDDQGHVVKPNFAGLLSP